MQVTGQTAKTVAELPAAMRPAGEPVSLITGQESLDELRKKIIKLSQDSSARRTPLHSPFHIMGSLSRDSLTTLVNSLSREACLDLFKIEQNCRLHSGAPSAVKSASGTPGWT